MTSGWIASSRRPSETWRLASCRRTAGTSSVSTYILPSGSWSPKRLSGMSTSIAADGEALDGRVGRARLAGAGERARLLGALHREDEGRRGDGEDEAVAGDAAGRRPPLGAGEPPAQRRSPAAAATVAAAISRQAGSASAPSRSMCRPSGSSWPPWCGGEEHGVDRVADRRRRRRRRARRRRRRGALEPGPGRDADAADSAAHEPERQGDGEQHERQGERRVAQPVHEEARLVALHAALAGVEELQPGIAAVGQGDGQRGGADQARVERSLLHDGSVAVSGGALVGGRGFADPRIEVDHDRLVATGVLEFEASRAPSRGIVKPRLASTAASGCSTPARTLA